jgi:DNA polymerase-3 subunit gamma/tau
MNDTPKTAPESDAGYKVLARKYRPADFEDLIGQEAMVRTLKNAFEKDRIAHAFIMTGVRGVGKTTTARIIAKGLNCIGADGTGGPTIQPCGVCEHCVSIAESRHVDVLEMDAASRTGVGDIREIIDSVRYRAASARYKVYIIDEVHMLSTSAFNALLKTLEEPPEHVKFIFATTEIRKVPVTVLSRCQRFDLRRIEPETMIAYLGEIAAKEGAEIAGDAMALIVRASEGSMRDALSLMDQAIAHGAGETTADQVRAMLGLADRGRVLDLFDLIMKGDCGGALNELGAQYAAGADPLAVLRDLAEVTHWISVVQIQPEAAEDPTVSPDERARGKDMADRLGMRSLTRMWQMLLKAIDEVGRAPNAMMAAEMAMIRLTHVADLPSPEELVRKLGDTPAPTGGGARPGPSGEAPGNGGSGNGARARVSGNGGGGPTAALVSAPAVGTLDQYARFEDVVALIREKRDGKLLVEVEGCLQLVSYSPGRIEFAPTEDAPTDLAATLAQRLQLWTGARWMVSIAGGGGAATIRDQKQAETDARMAELAQHPLVLAALAVFPDAEIREAKPAPEAAEDAPLEAIDEDDAFDDDWAPVDPFEEE